MTSIAISAGHGKYIRGASGPAPWGLDEVDEARRVCTQVVEYLKQMGVTVYGPFFDDTSTSQNTNLSTIVNWHNRQPSHDLDVSIHFNAYQTTTTKPMGTETLYVTQETLADTVSEAVSHAGAFLNRGPKYRSDLYFLNNTHAKSVLEEVCFCDAKPDCDLYHAYFSAICLSLAESLSGQTLSEQPPEEIEPPPETETPPPSEPMVGTVHGLTSGDTLNIRATASSSSPVIGRAENNDLVTVISSAMNGDTQWYQLKFGDDHMAGVAIYGWAAAGYIRVDGNVPEAEEEWRTGITATEFGGGGDQQDSAYPDVDWIDDDTCGVALPYKWKSTPRPQVIVKGPTGEVTTEIVDLGPWNLDDPEYVLNGARPIVEAQYEDREEAQNGQVPSNDAAIDLTPPIAEAVGISGKGKVQWKFADASATTQVASHKPKHKGKRRA